MRIATVAVATMLLPCSALAQVPRRPKKWTAEFSASHIVFGDKRPTGGWGPQVSFRGPIGRGANHLSITVGGRVTAFDFSSWYWMAVLAGPEVGATFPLPLVPEAWSLYGSVLAGVDYGQWSQVTNWGLPMRWWGFQSRFAPGVVYEPAPGVAVRAQIGLRRASTPMNDGYDAWLPRNGLSIEPQISGVFGWGD